MGIFDLDSKFMHWANKFADLMGLNILTLICCLPIFTIGASLTAMHHVMLQIYRNEESYIAKTFFKSFKENFKQSTIIWLLYLLVIAVLGVDFWATKTDVIEVNKFIEIAMYFVALLVAFSLSWVFVLQSRYTNTVKNTIKNAMVVGITHFAYSIMMILLAAIPVVLLLLWDMAVPFVFVFGFTVPAFLQAMLYSRVFDRMEGVDRKARKEGPVDDGWSVDEDREQPELAEQSVEVPGEQEN